MNLGSRLKSILEDRGLNVTQFSKQAGIPAQTVYALINRDSNKADMDILMKLLTALKMDFFTFMDADVPANVEPSVPENVPAAPAPVSERIVEKVVVKEVPAAAPSGKAALYINAKIHEKIVALAAEEGISDEAVLTQALEEYLELGFGYRQRPLRSILRDSKPKSGRSGDMDSFLL